MCVCVYSPLCVLFTERVVRLTDLNDFWLCHFCFSHYKYHKHHNKPSTVTEKKKKNNSDRLGGSMSGSSYTSSKRETYSSSHSHNERSASSAQFRTSVPKSRVHQAYTQPHSRRTVVSPQPETTTSRPSQQKQDPSIENEGTY